jgi:poly-gamma-glutamate synthesis protein (capsule biosynthesis protein)
MEPRSARHGRRKKQRNPLITICVLSVLIIAAFSGLLHWLMNREDTSAVPPSSAVSNPGSDTGNIPGANSPAGGYSGTEPPQSAVLPAHPSQPQAEDGQASSPKDTGTTEKVKLAFVGDVMWASKVEDLLKQHGYDYPYREARTYLENADLTLANLETPITTRGQAQAKSYIYRSTPQALPAFIEAGFDLVNLANNHILDYGKVGLLDTLQALDDAGVKHVGAGKNIGEAYSHVIYEIKGMKIAFLGFSRVAEDKSWYATVNQPGVAQTYTPNLALEAIKKAREEADLVVVMAHWGEERKDKPVQHQTSLAHQYIDNGADLVVASHPHVLQSFEHYNGKWIAYSLGNFIFTTNNVPATWETVIMNAYCSKTKECEIELIPMYNKWAQPVLMPEDEGKKLFNRLSQISINAKVDATGKLVPNDSLNKPQ